MSLKLRLFFSADFCLKYIFTKGDLTEIFVLEISTPGKLDVQMVKYSYDNGDVDLSDNSALEFILQSDKTTQDRYQEYLSQSLLSSHMRCVAKKSTAKKV